MIVSLFLYIFSYLIGFFALLLPDWTIWPQDLKDGIYYFADKIGDLNIILPIDNWFIAAQTFVRFLIYFLIFKLIVGIINWIRGAGSIYT
jgi:hypothetical protein